MKRFLRVLIVHFGVFSFLFTILAGSAFAQLPPPPGARPPVVFNFMDIFHLKNFANAIRAYVIGIGVFIALIMIPYAAVLMASGSPDNIQKGKDWLVSVISGLIVLLLSGAIIRLIGTEFLSLR